MFGLSGEQFSPILWLGLCGCKYTPEKKHSYDE
jgi:hypothetical protein